VKEVICRQLARSAPAQSANVTPITARPSRSTAGAMTAGAAFFLRLRLLADSPSSGAMSKSPGIEKSSNRKQKAASEHVCTRRARRRACGTHSD
jgi:hypothetical protein